MVARLSQLVLPVLKMLKDGGEMNGEVTLSARNFDPVKAFNIR
jgi:hypothetical protein